MAGSEDDIDEAGGGLIWGTYDWLRDGFWRAHGYITDLHPFASYAISFAIFLLGVYTSPQIRAGTDWILGKISSSLNVVSFEWVPSSVDYNTVLLGLVLAVLVYQSRILIRMQGEFASMDEPPRVTDGGDRGITGEEDRRLIGEERSVEGGLPSSIVESALKRHEEEMEQQARATTGHVHAREDHRTDNPDHMNLETKKDGAISGAIAGAALGSIWGPGGIIGGALAGLILGDEWEKRQIRKNREAKEADHGPIGP